MNVLSDASTYTGGACVMAMGMFDGMHVGHRSLIALAVDAAARNHVPAVVFTYAEHPLRVLRPEIAPKPLMDTEKKLCIMEKMRVDTVCLVRFDEALAQTPAEDFLRNLCRCFQPVSIVVGYNHTFGKGGKGNEELIRSMADELGYEAQILPPVEMEGQPVSSSRIRRLLQEGDAAQAKRLLGEE